MKVLSVAPPLSAPVGGFSVGAASALALIGVDVRQRLARVQASYRSTLRLRTRVGFLGRVALVAAPAVGRAAVTRRETRRSSG